MGMTVYIIGNGPSVLLSELGKQIDDTDIVVRLNDFNVTGFEKFVGSKTDIVFTCRLNEYIDRMNQFPVVITCLLMNPLNGVTIPDTVLQQVNQAITWEYVDKLLPVLGLMPGCYPTTGFLCVLHMIRCYGHVNIIGFDGLGNGNQHYYETGDRPHARRHDGRRERDWFNLFESLGLLTDHSKPVETGFKYIRFDGEAPFIQ